MQILCNGIISGLTIGLLATAFNAVYLPTRVFHIALGAVYAAAPFFVWRLLLFKQSWPLAVALALVGSVLISLACETFNHARLERKGGSSGTHLIASLGIYIILVQAVAVAFGNETKFLRVGVDSVFTLGSVTLSRAQLFAGAASILLLAIFYAWVRLTNLGLRLRALADNPAQLALQGYNIRQVRLLAFAIAGLLASACSLVVAYDIGFDPQGGLVALLLAIVAVIIGGRDTWLGPILGGILLGIIRAEVVWFMSAKWQDAITYALLALFLLVRPGGLLGRGIRLEARA
jgi:branched-chain amino acid transport system permease protein